MHIPLSPAATTLGQPTGSTRTVKNWGYLPTGMLYSPPVTECITSSESCVFGVHCVGRVWCEWVWWVCIRCVCGGVVVLVGVVGKYKVCMGVVVYVGGCGSVQCAVGV